MQGATPTRRTRAHAPRRLRADIQALRALAVLLVVLNHLWPALLPGGYIGVDIFFVISGYLITLHLVRELAETGRVRLPRFYARRARRLLPAALLVTVASLLASLVLLPADRWERTAFEGFAATGYFQNWALIASATNYFTQASPPTPFQHYWSLSVEEQFYLFWPLALAGGYLAVSRRAVSKLAQKQSTDGRASRTLALVLAAGCGTLALGSLAFSHALVLADPSGAYFNTPGRVWEFMLGAIVALTLGRHAPGSPGATSPLRSATALAQGTGWLTLLTCAVLYSPTTPFPGLPALLPTAATALIIATGPTVALPALCRLISTRTVQGLGAISYSLYLWHWPLIVLTPYALGRALTHGDRLTLLALSLLLAAATTRWVENPTRGIFAHRPARWTLLPALTSVLTLGLTWGGVALYTQQSTHRPSEQAHTASLTSCIGATALISTNNCQDALTAPATHTRDYEAPWRNYPTECAVLYEDRAEAGNAERHIVCDYSHGAPNPHDLWLVGDSHAEHWMEAALYTAQQNSWRLTLHMHSGCPALALPTATDYETAERRAGCLDWATRTEADIGGQAPETLVLTSARSHRVEAPAGTDLATHFAHQLTARVDTWGQQGTSIIVLRDTPAAGETLGAPCVEQLYGGANTCLRDRAATLADSPDPMAQGAALTDGRVQVLDLTDSFCTTTCSGVVGGVQVYYDTDHLTRSYSASLGPVLHRELTGLAR